VSYGTQQPKGPTRLNWGNILTGPFLESVFLGSRPGVNLVNGALFTKIGNPAQIGGSDSSAGPLVTQANAYYIPAVASSAPWTVACVITPTATMSTGNANPLIGMGNPNNNGTTDRSLYISGTTNWSAYVFDGGSKLQDSGISYAVGRTDRVVFWCDANGLAVEVNGRNLNGTLATANTGFAAYGTPAFALGSTGTGADANCVISLAVRVNGKSWSAAERLAFAQNPWQMFLAPPRRAIFSSAGSSNVTVGITGVVGTGAAGNTGVQHDQPITGNAATGAVGTVGVNTGPIVTGVVGTGAAGNVTPSTTVALTGVVGTGAAGNVSGSSGGDLTLAITGVSATGQVGNVGITKDGSVALTGAAATGTAGSVGVQHDQAVTGVAATTAVGSVTPSLTVSLTGVVGTGAVGTVGASSGGDKTVAITGVSATGYAGILTPSGGDAGVTGGGHGRYNLGHKKGVGDDIEEYLELLKERARKKAEERLERERRKAEEIEEARERLAAVRKEGQTAASRKEAARIVANLRKLEAQEQKAKEEGTRRRQQEADDQDFMDALVFLDNLGE